MNSFADFMNLPVINATAPKIPYDTWLGSYEVALISLIEDHEVSVFDFLIKIHGEMATPKSYKKVLMEFYNLDVDPSVAAKAVFEEHQ